jgi:hypothetical protein
VFLALLALAAPWSARAGDSARGAERIFAALGVERELREVADAAAASVASGPVPKADARLMRAVVATGFDPELLRKHALAIFEENYDSAYAEAALAWLARPETRALLAHASGADLPRGTDAEVVSPERDELLRRLDLKLGRQARAERHADLVLEIMLRTANPLLPSVSRYTTAEIDALLAAQHQRAAHSEVETTLRARYAGVATAEIRETVRFLESDPGLWLLPELDAALTRSLVRAAEATAAELVEVLGSGAPAAPLRTASVTPR